MNIIDISGKWMCSSPDGSIKKEVNLPGSSCENQIGKKAHYFENYEKSTVRAPLEKYEYIGELIYERDIEIPAEWEGHNISVFFERINVASKLYFDDVLVGRGVIELTTPHIYKLTDRHNSKGEELIKNVTGKHHLRLVIDNRNLLNMGDMASGYSIDTQGYWNGCIGRMELQAHPINYIESIAVFTKEDGINVRTTLVTNKHIPMQIEKGTLSFAVKGPDGSLCRLGDAKKDIELFSMRQTVHFYIPMAKEDIKKWDEFDRNLYEIQVTLECDTCKDMCHDTFGFRTIKVEDKRFKLNGKTLSLRGTINCAQYPLTGYPPMDTKTWEKHFETFKEHGLNHVRFHAWCPPEAAFVAADKLGIYLSVEMPLWLNHDVTPMEFGDDEWHELYYRTEALRISRFYGNHPSFVFFSNGNENLGDFTLLETIIAETKAIDDRRVYTMTSNFDHPMSPFEDYLCAFEIFHRRARIQTLHDVVAESTTLNYDVMAGEVPVPFTSFEVGQYCVYPNVDLCEKYTGNILPTNLDIIRKMMKEKGVYDKLQDYIKASGDLAAKLYKEDIEAVMRTKGMGGFQLLSLVDYTGQSTATVGMLDVFHESKGVISPKEWCEFCNEVVPLFQSKRIFSNKENLNALLTLYDYGKEYIKNPVYELRFEKEGEVIYRDSFKGDSKKEDSPVDISIPLGFIEGNSLIKVYLKVNEYENSFRIFVIDEDSLALTAEKTSRLIVNTKEELDSALYEGRNVIALRGAFDEEQYKNSFIPVFWSPVHFPSPDPCGALIDKEHEALKLFPTDKYIDYQWKTLLDNSVSLAIAGKDNVEPIMEMVPNFVDNVAKSPLFLINMKSSKVLFCGFDIQDEDIMARVLLASLLDYMDNL